MLRLASRNADKLRNVQRIVESMKMYVWRLHAKQRVYLHSPSHSPSFYLPHSFSFRVFRAFYLSLFSVVGLIVLPELREGALTALPKFLQHSFPKVLLRLRH